MSSFAALPEELRSKILLQLDYASIARCQRVSKAFHRAASSEHIWRTACQRMGYLTQGQTLKDVRPSLPEDVDNLLTAYEEGGRRYAEFKDYKTFFSSTHLLQKVKSDADLSLRGGMEFFETGTPAQSIKIDHTVGLMLAACTCWGYLKIYELDSKQHLRTFHGHEHMCAKGRLEAAHGWIVHASWTLDALAQCTRSDSGPSLDLIRLRLWTVNRSTQGDGHVDLTSQGSILPAHSITEFRLHFPVLAIASSEGYITFYDITTSEMTQDIRLTPPGHGSDTRSDIGITSFDFNDDFIWVAFRFDRRPFCELQAYSRTSGQLLWRLDPGTMPQHCSLRQVVFHQDGPGNATTNRTDCHLKSGSQDQALLQESAGHWAAINFDRKSNSLCFMRDDVMFCVPNVQNFKSPQGHQQILTLAGSAPRTGYEELHSLAVADGRAAFSSSCQLVLVDLISLTCLCGPPLSSGGDCTGHEWQELEERALASSVRCYHPVPEKEISMLGSAAVITLTATRLAMAGCSPRWQTKDVSGIRRALLGQRVPNLLGDYRLEDGIFSIDFDKMRTLQVDTVLQSRRAEVAAYFDNVENEARQFGMLDAVQSLCRETREKVRKSHNGNIARHADADVSDESDWEIDSWDVDSWY
ncbi:unnamed protein product [Sympodiomycopsis kandeliae]